MSVKLLLCALAGMSLLASPDAAGDTGPQGSMNNLHETLTDCATFYSIGAMCVGSSDPALHQRMVKAQGNVEEMAALIGEGLGMSQDAMLSRVKLRSSAMLNLMENKCINFGSIIRRYAAMCKAASEDPVGFTNHGGVGR